MDQSSEEKRATFTLGGGVVHCTRTPTPCSRLVRFGPFGYLAQKNLAHAGLMPAAARRLVAAMWLS